MKKLVIAVFIICAVLLSGVYVVGMQAEQEMGKLFSQLRANPQSPTLLSYQRHFFQATAVTEVTLTAQGQQPVVLTVTSQIYHYPYKAVINNKVTIADPQLRSKVERYFAGDDWLTSTESINLLGQLTGKLQLASGRYQSSSELLTTESLQLSYQVNLKDYSGSIAAVWQGGKVNASELQARIAGVTLSSDFSSFAMAATSSYRTDIKEVSIDQQQTQVQLEQISLRGSSRPGHQADTLDSSNHWQVASYLVTNGEQQHFTDNYLQLDLKGLSIPALAQLSHISDQPELVGQGLNELMAHGGEISLSELTSQTPWGKVDGQLQLVVQPGAKLAEIISNPFMLLDYTSGSARVLLPEALLQLPALRQPLQIGVQTGLLEKNNQTLTMETQLQRGELTVNGRVIPL